MNQRVIWAIVGLMSAAVIGVVWLQMNLIRTSITTIEEKTEENVYEALNEVVDRLELEEQQQAFQVDVNGYSINIDRQGLLRPNSLLFPDSGDPFKVYSEILRMLDEEEWCMCVDCMKDRQLGIKGFSSLISKSYQNYIPLEERIQPVKLAQLLDQELKDRGIDMEYVHGVFSKEKNSFVIVDDYYTVEEDTKTMSLLSSYSEGESGSGQKPYKVRLFPRSQQSPGLLIVHFPAMTSFVWRSLWMNLLGTILFAGIILGCFAYSVNVIIKQKKVSEMKTDFINNMTHEFKTPIATISLAADSITSPMISTSPDKVQRFAGIIKQENKRMNSQVEKVLQMALLDKRDFSLKLTEFNLHQVIDSAVENIMLQVEKKQGKAKAILDATNPVIQGDLTHVSNIINNLLDNANKYSPDNPEITIHTRNVPNGVEVVIADKGVGMTKEARKHIFDKFYRVHTGNLHDVKGFGLGLSYVKAMMTAHKGQIDVKSELGKGSSFILFFPFYVENKTKVMVDA